MGLTEKYSNDEVIKQKAQAFDNMQKQAEVKGIAKQGYEAGLADSAKQLQKIAEMNAMREQMAIDAQLASDEGLAARMQQNQNIYGQANTPGVMQ